MPLVICPGCRTTLNVGAVSPGQSICCSVCKTLFQMPAAPAVPMAMPVAPTAALAPPVAQWQPEIPTDDGPEAPVDRSAFALSGSVADDEPIDTTAFTMTRSTSDVMHNVRVETVVKETADALFLAIGINIVAAFVTAFPVGMLSKGNLAAFLLGWSCIALWLGVLVVVGYGAVCLKQLRRPDLARLAGVGAVGTGILVLAVAGTAFALALIPTGSLSVFTVLIVMVAELMTAAVALFTIYVGIRTLGTLRRPEVMTALTSAVPVSHTWRARSDPEAKPAPTPPVALPPGQPPMPPT